MTKNIRVLFFTLLLDLIGIGMIIPIIPIIFTDPSSPTFLLHAYKESSWYFIAGLATGLYGLMQFLAAPLLGELSDMYGRKKLLALGVGVLALSNLFLGIGITMLSLTIVLISRLIGGLAGANFSIAQAAIADSTKPEDRAKTFGLIGAAFGIGFIIGPLLGGYLATFFHNPAAPFFVAGLLGVINFALVTFFFEETLHTKSLKKKVSLLKAFTNMYAAFTDDKLSRLFIANLLYMLGFAAFTSFSGLYLVKKYAVSEATLGTYFGIVGVCIVITQGFILRVITKYYDEKTILRVSVLGVSFALLLTPFMPTLLFQYLLVPFIAVPQGLSMANLSALLSKSAGSKGQGTVLGISGSLSAFAQGVVPVSVGFIAGHFGVAAPFILGSGALFSSWLFLFVFDRK